MKTVKSKFLLSGLCAAFFLSWCAVGNAASTGTGFFVTADGFFVTNYHVIEDSNQISIRDSSGETYLARVVRIDRANDLALLKAEGRFRPVPISSSREVRRGDRVFTLGFPNISVQGAETKYTEGVISSLSGLHDAPNNFQITVPIQPGNSGGPLVSSQGNVIGVVTSKLSAGAMLLRSGSLPENVNYAVKSNYLLELLTTHQQVSKNLISPRRSGARSMSDMSEQIEASVGLVVARKISVATENKPISEPQEKRGEIGLKPKPPFAQQPSQTHRPSFWSSTERPSYSELTLIAEEKFEIGRLGYPTHLLSLNVIILSGSGWERAEIPKYLGSAARLLSQCGIRVKDISLYEYGVPERMLPKGLDEAKELAGILKFQAASIYFSSETPSNASEGEVFAIGNKIRRDEPLNELRNSVWLKHTGRDPSILIARLLIMMLRNNQAQSPWPNNLLYYGGQSAPNQTLLDGDQCRQARDNGLMNGLLNQNF